MGAAAPGSALCGPGWGLKPPVPPNAQRCGLWAPVLVGLSTGGAPLHPGGCAGTAAGTVSRWVTKAEQGSPTGQGPPCLQLGAAGEATGTTHRGGTSPFSPHRHHGGVWGGSTPFVTLPSAAPWGGGLPGPPLRTAPRGFGAGRWQLGHTTKPHAPRTAAVTAAATAAAHRGHKPGSAGQRWESGSSRSGHEVPWAGGGGFGSRGLL